MPPADELFASDLERRAVAHLPVYRKPGEKVEVYDKYDKNGDPVGKPRKVDAVAHMREAGGLPDDWTPATSVTIAELRRRVTADEFAPSPTETEFKAVVDAVIEKGYVKAAGDSLAMTADGLEALTA